MHFRRPLKLLASKFLILSIVSLFLLALLCFLLFFSISYATHHHSHPHSPPHFSPTASVPLQIHQACAATRFPETCEAFLIASNRVPPNPKLIDVIQSALRLSFENLKTAQSMVEDILDSSAENQNRTTAAKNCLELLHYSEYRISSTVDALPRGKIKDARAWMSAALLYQYDCWSALSFANDTQQVNKTMSFIHSLLGLSSNGLSMMASYDIFGDNIGSWRPPQTERDGFWESSRSGEGSELGFKGGVRTDLPPGATVCKAGRAGGCYETVQEAVDAIPDNAGDRKFVIRIREGVYEEIVRVPLEKKNVVFLGDGMGKTVITGSLSVGQPGISTYNTATVGVNGDGFMARGMTFQNTAGPDAHQAVAFRSDSDLSVIENCEFLGNQDTLYAHSLRQFYKSCTIQGDVDFIFGNSASIFQDCLILIRPRQLNPEKGEANAVTAHGRTDPAQTTGFVFHNCVVNGTVDFMKLYYSKPKVHRNFLGRPWKEYSRTVFIRCFLEVLVTPQGWMPWIGDFALKTLYYGEFENSGSGANLSERVPWSSLIPAQQINLYSVQNFIQGSEWIPTTS